MHRLLVVVALAACHHPANNPMPPPSAACDASSKVIVLGQVWRPGSIGCRPGMRLVDAITLAGGFTLLAWKNQVKLHRGPLTYVVHVEAILDGEQPDVLLAPGDEIFVGERNV